MVPLLGIYFQPLTCLETHDDLYTYHADHEHPHTPRSKFHACKVVKQLNLSFMVQLAFLHGREINLGSCIEFSSLASLRVVAVYYWN